MKLEKLPIQHQIDFKNQAVYSYFKKMGYVNGTYARKMLGVGKEKFRYLMEMHDIVPIEMPAPTIEFKTKLYKIEDIKTVRELINSK